jgi:hypothetical protein
MIKRRNGTKAEKCIMYGRRQTIKKNEWEKRRVGEWVIRRIKKVPADSAV